MKNIFITFALAFTTTFSFGQHFEAGLMLGGGNYIGDLSENTSRIFLNETRFAAGAFAKYNFGDYIALKLGLNYANISGHDSNASEVSIRDRNLSFRSPVFELGLTAEFNILGYQPYALYRVFSPYVFVGISAIQFNPKANYQGEWIDLQPLGTEGQGLAPERQPYSRNSYAIPFGIGVKYALNDKINFGLEVGFRRTFTDYLDDVSGTYFEFSELLAGNGALAAALGNRTGELTGSEPVFVPTGTPRGDDSNADWMMIAGFTVSYNFMDNGLMGSRGKRRGGKGCKTSRF